MSTGQFKNSASLPGLATANSYAPHRVWKNSARAEVKFRPLADNPRESRRRAARLWHDARRFERQTRKHGKQDGAIGRNGLACLQALLFDFFSHVNGRLDPSYETLARAANISIRSAARGLQALKAAGLLHWERRQHGEMRDGRWCIVQETNAYGVLLQSMWRGFRRAPEASPPDPDSWGAAPPIPSGLDAAAQAARDAADADPAPRRAMMMRALEDDPGDGLAGAIARLSRRLF